MVFVYCIKQYLLQVRNQYHNAMKKLLLLVLFAGLLSIVVPLQVKAGEVHEGWFGDYFNLKENRCYGRTYSKSHMAKHPRQRVKKIWIGHFPVFDQNPPEGYNPVNTQQTGIIFIRVKVWFTDNPYVFSQTGLCQQSGKMLSCPIECDGGQFSIHGRDKKLLLKTNGFLVVTDDGCGDKGEGETYRRLGHKKSDDNAFLLSELPMRNCRIPKLH